MKRPLDSLAEIGAGALDAYLASRSLAEYVRQAWPLLHQRSPLIWNWHLDAICQHLEACSRGELQKLIINIPPGMMKSLLTGVFWQTWLWTTRPDTRWLMFSYDADLTIRDNLRARLVIESPWYRSRWGQVFRLAADQKQKTRFNTDRHGFRVASSVGGMGTGERADFLLIDDPLSAQQAFSTAARENVVRWYDQTASTRGADPRSFVQVVIMQRLHTRDLTGHLLELGGWEHLMIPMRYEPYRSKVTSLGWKDPRLYDGELLFPELFPPEKVVDLARTLTPLGASAQLQQSPLRAEGDLFRSEKFRYYAQDGFFVELQQAEESPRRYDLTRLPWFQTSDTASTERITADATATGTFAMTPEGDLLVVDMTVVRIEAAGMYEHCDGQRHRWGEGRIVLSGVENAASGIAVLQEARKRMKPFVELKPKGSKYERAIAASILYDSGKVWHPAARPSWLNGLEQELLDFPTGEHDDQVDVLSYAAWVIATYGHLLNRGRNVTEGRVLADFPGMERFAEEAKAQAQIEARWAAPAPDTPAEDRSVLDYLGVR